MKKAIWFPANKIKKLKLNRAGIRAFENIDRYDWILFSSKNTVRFFVRELQLRRLKIEKTVRTAKIAAVGPETAAALGSAGFRVSLMPKKFSTERLVKALGAQVSGKRVLFPRSAIASTDSVRKLRSNGAKVDVVHLYVSIPSHIPKNLFSVIKNGGVKYIAFTSPSAVNSFIKNMLDFCVKYGATKMCTISAVCIGPSTALVARGFPFKKIIVSKISTKAGIEALLRKLP